MWDGANSATYAYDNASRLTGITCIYDTSALTKTVAYGYDASSRRTLMTDGEGASVAYLYDDADRLLGVTESGNTRGTYDLSPMYVPHLKLVSRHPLAACGA